MYKKTELCVTTIVSYNNFKTIKYKYIYKQYIIIIIFNNIIKIIVI